MKTLDKREQRNNYERLLNEQLERHTAQYDLVKYIDKMIMVGSKFKELDEEIKKALWTRRHDKDMEDFQNYCNTELAALTYMAGRIHMRVHRNRLICCALSDGNREVMTYRKDYETVALMVKEKELAVKEDLLQLMHFRQREPLMVS